MGFIMILLKWLLDKTAKLSLWLPPLSEALSRPVWYQVGLDLQPWGCQPPGLVSCGRGLTCPGQWMGLSTMGSVYPLTAVTVTVLIVVTHFVYQRRQIFSRILTTRSQSIVPPELLLPPKSGSPPSDRALLCNVLHMLDAVLNHIEGHLRQLANHAPPSASASRIKSPSACSAYPWSPASLCAASSADSSLPEDLPES